MIEYLESRIVFENPRPHVHSRHGYFPGMVHLGGDELLCLFVRSEAFESPDATTWIARSRDLGRSWTLAGPLYDKRAVGFETSDSFKATRLRDGSLVAMGYRFHRLDPEQGIALEETGGILPGDVVVTFSRDQGTTWETPTVVPRSRPELYEVSGPCVETSSGALLAVGALFKLPDGTNPSGQCGVLLRSLDGGRTWDDRTVYFRAPLGNLTPFEARLCEMQPGRLVALVWAYDYATDRHHPNHVAVSHDGGATWSAPIDTGNPGQASGLLYAGGDRLLTIHAHRGSETGIFVRVVDLSGDEWRPVEEFNLFGANLSQTREGMSMREMFSSLRFGQPSLLHLEGDEYLATHWSVEDGQGKIRSHRLRIRPW